MIETKLPGDQGDNDIIHSVIRVNHAGEYGAKRIYAGQLAILKNKPCAETIRHMAEQEDEHLAAFSEMIGKRRVRPTILLPIWHVAGFALGAGTALLGEKAAMACTVAVEEVIEEHYTEQLNELDDSEKEMKQKIEKFRAEEVEHRDIGLANGAEDALAYPILSSVIKNTSKAAIWLSKRV